MIHLYYADFSSVDPAKLIPEYSSKIDPERLQKVIRTKADSAKVRSLIAGYLLQVGVKRHLEEKITKALKSDTTRISKAEQAVLDLFKDKTNWSVPEMADVLSKNGETVKKTVQNLVKKDLLEKKGTTKGTYYILK